MKLGTGHGGRPLAGDQRDEHLPDGGAGELPEARAGSRRETARRARRTCRRAGQGRAATTAAARPRRGRRRCRPRPTPRKPAARRAERALAQPLRQPECQAGGDAHPLEEPPREHGHDGRPAAPPSRAALPAPATGNARRVEQRRQHRQQGGEIEEHRDPERGDAGAHPHAVAPVEQGHVAQLADPRRQQVHEHVAGGGHEGEGEQAGHLRLAAAAQQEPVAPGAQQGLGDLREKIRADQRQLDAAQRLGEPTPPGCASASVTTR